MVVVVCCWALWYLCVTTASWECTKLPPAFMRVCHRLSCLLGAREAYTHKSRENFAHSHEAVVTHKLKSAQHCAALYRRRCMPPVARAGMEASVADFEVWVALMLLDALQRHGWFGTAGETLTMDALRAGCIPAYARFVPEAVGILQMAGVQSCSAVTP